MLVSQKQLDTVSAYTRFARPAPYATKPPAMQAVAGRVPLVASELQGDTGLLARLRDSIRPIPQINTAETLTPINEQTARNAHLYAPARAAYIGTAGYALAGQRAYVQAASKNGASGNMLAFTRSPAQTEGESPLSSAGPVAPPRTGCKTCASRVYQDGSNDSGVSFQTPSGMPASLSGVRVASHEGEHVTRETGQASEDGRTVLQKKVTLQAAFCPECGRMYYKGGQISMTTTGNQSEQNGNADSAFSVQNAASILGAVGENIDTYV